jgi:hypothetical protein
MVRSAYRIQEDGPGVQVFNGTPNDLSGFRAIPDNRLIFWPNFFQFPDRPRPANSARKIDTLISEDLFQLPTQRNPAVRGINNLAARNLLRGKRYGLPNGQRVAKALRAPVLSNARLGLPRPWRQAPLWWYILAEANVTAGGKRLGPTGGTIVASTLVGLLKVDENSILNKGLPIPLPPEGSPDFSVPRLLERAGVVPPPPPGA